MALHGISIPWTEMTPGCTFNVYNSTTNDFATSTQIATGVAASPYQFSTGIAGTLYYFWITAVLNGEESGPSNAVDQNFPSPPPPPAAPVVGAPTQF